MSKSLKLSDEEFGAIMAELKKFLMLAQEAVGVENRKQHIIDIYKIYNRIEDELNSKNYWLEQMEMFEEKYRKYMEQFEKNRTV